MSGPSSGPLRVLMAPAIVAVSGSVARQSRPEAAKNGRRGFASKLVFRVSNMLHLVLASRS
jgi:hypothetical protein